MKKPDEPTRLRHMLDAARKGIHITQGRSRADLDADDVLALALVRLIEVIGEAAKGVGETTRTAYPAIPWRQIAGARDHLIHGYFDVDLDIVWNVVCSDLPPLVAELERAVGGASP